MTMINNWTESYSELRRRAVEVRGLDEAPSDVGDGASWPRTTGADAVEIAALIDPAVRDFASPGLHRRWQARLHEIGRDGVHALDATFPENRALWRALEDLVVFFDQVGVPPLRPGLWDALVSRIGAPDELRNAGPVEDGPFARFEGVKTYDQLWLAQRTYLAGKRGFDHMPVPPGFGGPELDVPRTTNADVLQLATYWTNAMANLAHLMGYDRVKTTWDAALADIDRLAKTGKPDDLYPLNNIFWHAMLRVSIQVAVTNEAPSTWPMIVDSVKDSVHHLPETLEHAGEKGVDLLADAARATGKAVSAVGGGLLGGLKVPLLVGGGLLGVYLLARRPHHEEV